VRAGRRGRARGADDRRESTATKLIGVDREQHGRAGAREQEAGEGGADDAGQVELHALEGDRAVQLVARDEPRDQDLPGRDVEGHGDAVEQAEGDEHRRGRAAEGGGDGQQDGDHHHQHLGDEEQAPAIEAVGREPAEQAEDQHRAELRGREGAEHDGGAGLLGHQPLHAEALHPRADRRDHRAEPDPAEPDVTQHAAPEPRGRELGRHGQHGGRGRVDLQVLRDVRV
jgi:hypothetical protein